MWASFSISVADALTFFGPFLLIPLLLSTFLLARFPQFSLPLLIISSALLLFITIHGSSWRYSESKDKAAYVEAWYYLIWSEQAIWPLLVFWYFIRRQTRQR